MENRSYALSAGLFLIFLCIGLVFAAVRLAGDTADHAQYVIASKFPVSGLQQNAPVRLRGVDVGKVGKIRFSHEDPRLILIDIAVGVLGAIPMAALLGNDAILDSVLAGGLGALIAIALLNLVRSRLRPS